MDVEVDEAHHVPNLAPGRPPGKVGVGRGAQAGVLMQELGKLALYLGAEPARPVGLDPAQVDVLGVLPAHRTVTNYAMTPVLGLIRGDFTPAPEAGEAEEASGPNLVGYGAKAGSTRRRARTSRRVDSAADGLAPQGSAAPAPAAGGPPPVPALRDARPPRALAKPPVRKLAKDLGVDLQAVAPSGDGGIVTRADVEGAASALRDGRGAPSSGIGGGSGRGVALDGEVATQVVRGDVAALGGVRDGRHRRVVGPVTRGAPRVTALLGGLARVRVGGCVGAVRGGLVRDLGGTRGSGSVSKTSSTPNTATTSPATPRGARPPCGTPPSTTRGPTTPTRP